MSEKKKAYIFDVYDDYEIRLRYVRDVFAEKGYQVTMYLSDFDHFHKEKYKTKRKDAEYIDVLPYSRNFSFARIRSHMKFAKSCLDIQKKDPADLVYVMVPPNSMAAQFGKHHKKDPSYRLIFDLCDMWPESFPVKGMKPVLAAPFSVWAGLRNRYMKYADLIMSECGLFADMIRKYVPEDIMETFWLCRRQIVKEVLPVDSDVLTFAYVGSLNHVVDVDAIAQTLTEIKKRVPLKFHIIGDGESRARLLEMLDREQIDYEYHGLVFDEEEKRKIFAKCHYGFNMMRDTTCIGMTMKSLDYFAYDLPVLNNVPADTWKMVEENSLGFNISGSSADIEKILSVKEEDYQSMRHNVIAFHRDHLSEEQFKQKLASYL